ncbi:MAG: phosphate regulon sensor histidine kinase PhoR [Gammaproteobacteria bacterium]|nr:phosphate regulon sensor histidine kinase PhoR [Gammaproteobacteria bacterium]
MNVSVWRAELQKQLLWLMLLWLFLLWLLGDGVWALNLALLFYIAWNLRQLYKVNRWLVEGGKLKQTPESKGLWEHLIQQMYQTQQKNRLRKQRLAKVLKRFHRSLEAIPDATIVLHNHGEIEWANQAAAHLLNIQNPHDHGQRIDNLIRDPAFHDYIHRGDFSHSLDIPSPVMNQVELNIRIVPFDEGHLLTVRDVSDFQRLQSVRREFVANVSHELRTPLTVIRGYVEALNDDPLPAESQQGVRAIQRQTLRMQEIVDDLLTLSRLEMEPLDLQEEWLDVPVLLESLCEDARRLSAQRQHVIQLSCQPLRLLGNRAELNSLFSNLIYNAVQHTPEGCRIFVKWCAEGEAARFSVRDKGVGIEAQNLSRLTERFYRVDAGRSRDKGGTGLGLSIVKHILARHGSYLEVESQRSKGSTFACSFSAERVSALAALGGRA